MQYTTSSTTVHVRSERGSGSGAFEAHLSERAAAPSASRNSIAWVSLEPSKSCQKLCYAFYKVSYTLFI